MNEEEDDKISDDLTFIENLEEYEHEKDAEDIIASTEGEEGSSESPELSAQDEGVEEAEEVEGEKKESASDFLEQEELAPKEESKEADFLEEVASSTGEEEEETLDFLDTPESDAVTEEKKEEEIASPTGEAEEETLDFLDTPESDAVTEEKKEEKIEPRPQESMIVPTTSPTTKESFEDVHQFAQAISYGNIGQGGNPPFSIIIKNIQYKEDGEGILGILSDYGLCDKESRGVYEQGIAQGALIIPQISEYAAIYLAHKCRRFAVDIQFGLSDEIYPAKSYSQEARGLVSKRSLTQNIEEGVSLQKKPVSMENMVVSGTSALNGYQIQKYIGVFFSHEMMDEEAFTEMSSACLENEGKEEEIESPYRGLIQDLKNQAYKAGANGVIDINYHVTPITRPEYDKKMTNYKITCTATAVWVTREGSREKEI